MHLFAVQCLDLWPCSWLVFLRGNIADFDDCEREAIWLAQEEALQADVFVISSVICIFPNTSEKAECKLFWLCWFKSHVWSFITVIIIYSGCL